MASAKRTLSFWDMMASALNGLEHGGGVLFRLMARVILWAVGGVFVGLFLAFLQMSMPLHPASFSLPIAFSLIGLIGFYVLITPALTGWHRYLTFGSADRGDGRLLGWDWRETRYALIVALLACLTLAIQAVIVIAYTQLLSDAAAGAWLVGEDPGRRSAEEFVWNFVLLGLVFWVAGMIAWALMVAVFCLSLPAAALGTDQTFGEAVALSWGLRIKIALALMATWVLSAIALVVVHVFLMFLQVAGGPGAIVAMIFSYLFYVAYAVLFCVFAAGVFNAAFIHALAARNAVTDRDSR